MNSSKILHIDIDSFFVSAELIRKPYLRGKPVVVIGEAKRSVVSSASYEARKYGISAGTPIFMVRKLCPQCILLPLDREFYEKLSLKFVSIVSEFSPDVEVSSIDEVYLYTKRIKNHFNTHIELADRIRKKILESTGLSVTIGIGKTKISSKVATEFAKPKGICELIDEEEFLERVRFDKFPGIGKSTFFSLFNGGILYGKDLKAKDPVAWEFVKGKYGKNDFSYEEKIRKFPPFKSISRGKTLPYDTADKNIINSHLSILSFELAKELIKNSLSASRISLKIRYEDFTEVEKSEKLTLLKNVYQSILASSKELLKRAYIPSKGRIRNITIQLSRIEPMYGTLLFKKEKQEIVFNYLVKAEKQLGKFFIFPASSVYALNDSISNRKKQIK